jgi:ESCRT-I complex subunit VPS28
MRIKDGKSGYRGEEASAGVAKRVFDITSKFIAPIDVLQLGITAVDEILPHLRDLLQALTTFPNMPPTYQGVGVVQNWCNILSAKKASDNITDDEGRQIKLDLDAACSQFKDVLQ